VLAHELACEHAKLWEVCRDGRADMNFIE